MGDVDRLFDLFLKEDKEFNVNPDVVKNLIEKLPADKKQKTLEQFLVRLTEQPAYLKRFLESQAQENFKEYFRFTVGSARKKNLLDLLLRAQSDPDSREICNRFIKWLMPMISYDTQGRAYQYAAYYDNQFLLRWIIETEGDEGKLIIKGLIQGIGLKMLVNHGSYECALYLQEKNLGLFEQDIAKNNTGQNNLLIQELIRELKLRWEGKYFDEKRFNLILLFVKSGAKINLENVKELAFVGPELLKKLIDCIEDTSLLIKLKNSMEDSTVKLHISKNEGIIKEEFLNECKDQKVALELWKYFNKVKVCLGSSADKLPDAAGLKFFPEKVEPGHYKVTVSNGLEFKLFMEAMDKIENNYLFKTLSKIPQGRETILFFERKAILLNFDIQDKVNCALILCDIRDKIDKMQLEIKTNPPLPGRNITPIQSTLQLLIEFQNDAMKCTTTDQLKKLFTKEKYSREHEITNLRQPEVDAPRKEI